ncbi:MAG: MMPL family transporter [Sterolibacterium sp.]|nr:MMPL family transporter [Sterolibacterium sp.]
MSRQQSKQWQQWQWWQEWQRYAALLWLIVVLCCVGYLGLRFSQASPVETDLLALLPTTEQNATAEAAVKTLTDQLGNRLLFLVGHAEPQQARLQAQAFAARLDQSGAFVRVIAAAPKIDVRLLSEVYAPYRAALLSPGDREMLLSSGFSAETLLLKRMHQPFQAGIATDLTLDPFGFLQRWLAQLPLAQSRLTVADGMLVAQDAKATYVFVLAEPHGSAFDGNVQRNVVAAVDVAEAALYEASPQAQLLRAGALFYGAAARSSAQHEVDLIGGGSLVGIVLLMWWLFRSLRPLLLGLTTVAIGIACGITAVLMGYGKIHLITLVFGASLIGEAIDYAIQYFAARLDAGAAWQPMLGLRRVLPGLAAALATSLIGYAVLALTPFPAIGQIALFAFVGLSAAWCSVILLLPFLTHAPSLRDVEQAVHLPRRILTAWRARATQRGVLLLAGGVLLLSVPGWLKLVADDDVRQLVARPSALVEQEARIRALVGASASGRFFLIEGRGDEEVLQREEALVVRLRSHVGHGIAGYSAISSFVPSRMRQEADRALLARALPPTQAARLLDSAGFQDAAARDWASALAHTEPLTLQAWRATQLAMPLKHQLLTTASGSTALLLTLNGDDATLDLTRMAEGLPGISLINKTASVSALFAEYRHLVAWWLPLAMVIVLMLLIWRYGLRQGGAMLLPTLVAMGVALAAYGYVGVPLTLFSIMGLVLVLGVGVNYAIFVVEAGDRAPAPFAGVLLSAATTLLSFGLLSLSSMPALHQFGTILLIGISASVLFAPVALTLGHSGGEAQ